ncbi:hypothetical protein niasHT_016806 [Heterodera trifolii]|uniref:BTB domain-containing protein n=1 Tax=Heterodera trifolii TaxID=157864 RepID=A0ABD2KYZ9_9BILA
MFRFDAKKEFAKSVTDVEPAAFKVMLSFIYTGELAELNDNVLAVLYAAKKHNIPDLVDASLQIPVSSLRNVFVAYDLAKLYELEVVTILIRISFSALRWADAKCSQNAIECSVENRRAVLGPALFKIRFPLIEEFSKKIAPSEVLSKDELIAVYQFHFLTNCHGKSDGLFPMQFPTNGRISDRKNGTLLMDIEKVSEFARENWKQSELMDPSNGFYDKSEDKVTLAIDVTVNEAKTEDES